MLHSLIQNDYATNQSTCYMTKMFINYLCNFNSNTYLFLDHAGFRHELPLKSVDIVNFLFRENAIGASSHNLQVISVNIFSEANSQDFNSLSLKRFYGGGQRVISGIFGLPSIRDKDQNLNTSKRELVRADLEDNFVPKNPTQLPPFLNIVCGYDLS